MLGDGPADGLDVTVSATDQSFDVTAQRVNRADHAASSHSVDFITEQVIDQPGEPGLVVHTLLDYSERDGLTFLNMLPERFSSPGLNSRRGRWPLVEHPLPRSIERGFSYAGRSYAIF